MVIKQKEIKALRRIAKAAGANMMEVLRAFEAAAKGNLVNAAKLFLDPMRYNTSKNDPQPISKLPESVITHSESDQSDTHKSESKGVCRARSNGFNLKGTAE